MFMWGQKGQLVELELICGFLSRIKFCLCCMTRHSQCLSRKKKKKKWLTLPARVHKDAARSWNLNAILLVKVCHLQIYCFIIMSLSEMRWASALNTASSRFRKAVTCAGTGTTENGLDSYLWTGLPELATSWLHFTTGGGGSGGCWVLESRPLVSGG